MELLEGCQILKKGTKMQFWYLQGDQDGNPMLILDKRKIKKTTTDVHKKKAKKKANFGGFMVLDHGTLRVYSESDPVTNFTKKIKIVLGEFITKPQKIEIQTGEEVAGGPQQIGKEYKGEDKETGWRADAAKEDKLYGALRGTLKSKKIKEALVVKLKLKNEKQLDALIEKSKDNPKALRSMLAQTEKITTRYLNAEEQAAAVATADKKGRLIQDGKKLKDGTRNFVVDAKDGTLKTAENLGGTVRDSDGRVENPHHSSLAAGGDVLGAGEIKTKGGRVTKLTDQSGHYKPDASKTYQVLKKLEKLGVKLVDDELFTDDGEPADVTKELEKRAKWLRGYTKGLDAENKVRRKHKEKALKPNAEAKQVIKDLKESKAWFRNKSMDVSLMGKKGTISEEAWEKVKGNAAKIDKLVKKEIGIEDFIKQHCRGDVSSRAFVNIMIGQETARTLSKEQFEQTGGNEDQIRAKDKMQEELLKKTAGKKKDLKKHTSKKKQEDSKYFQELDLSEEDDEDLVGEYMTLLDEDDGYVEPQLG